MADTPIRGWDGTNSIPVRVNAAGELVTGGSGGGSTVVDTELPAAAVLAEDMANPTAPAVGAYLMALDSTTWDRVTSDGTGRLSVDTELPTAVALSDTRANPVTPLIGATGMLFNGSTWERARTADAGTLATTGIPDGVALVTGPGCWSVKDEPAADTVAVATKAADAARRHVTTGFTACIEGTATAVSTVQLADGATILYAGRIRCAANDSASLTVTGLNIVGTINTAMTLTVSDPAVATATVTAALTGYSAAV